ncbi:MAG TPA: IS4 family transposase [Polyangia bacterium]|nr:IS4 family transposase [Polyangia bacterium]
MRVEAMVREVVEGCSSVMHASRLAALVKVVEGIIRGERLVPATIGRHLPGGTAPKHGIKCVDRLLGNAHFARDFLFIFLGLAHRLLGGCARPVILIDWTHAGGRYNALVAAVPIGGRALPIYIEVHPEKKLGNAAVEKRFLCSLKAILPASSGPPVVVSDAGFKGPFFEAVLELGWNFLGRVRGTTTARPSDGESISKEEFYAAATIHPADLGWFELFPRGLAIRSRLVLVRKRRKPGRKPPPPKNKEEREMRQAALDPWLLATSVPDGDAAFIVGLYAKRMQIEETFRDAKNHRFGWSLGDVQLSTHRRMGALLVLAAVAMTVVTLIGMGVERVGAHRGYQANTEKRRVLSFFVLACAVLARADARLVSLEEFRASLVSVASVASA